MTYSKEEKLIVGEDNKIITSRIIIQATFIAHLVSLNLSKILLFLGTMPSRCKGGIHIGDSNTRPKLSLLLSFLKSSLITGKEPSGLSLERRLNMLLQVLSVVFMEALEGQTLEV